MEEPIIKLFIFDTAGCDIVTKFESIYFLFLSTFADPVAKAGNKLLWATLLPFALFALFTLALGSLLDLTFSIFMGPEGTVAAGVAIAGPAGTTILFRVFSRNCFLSSTAMLLAVDIADVASSFPAVFAADIVVLPNSLAAILFINANDDFVAFDATARFSTFLTTSNISLPPTTCFFTLL